MRKVVINPQYSSLKECVEAIPDIFDVEGCVDYQGRNVIKIIDSDGLKLNVKSFKVPHLVNKFVYTNFRQSKAKRSFDYGNLLIKNDIHTPFPIAYIEEKKGLLLNRSFYISVHEDFDGMLRELQKGKLEGRENLLLQFARFTAQMHEKKILHIDYSPGNILYKKRDGQYDFYLVDLNRMQFGKYIGLQEGCFNLRKLWGSEEMITYIATEYAVTRGFDKEECVSLTLNYHTTFWEKFSKRHKGRRPYIGE